MPGGLDTVGHYTNMAFSITYISRSFDIVSPFLSEKPNMLRLMTTSLLGMWNFAISTASVPSDYGTAKEELGQNSMA